jgi:NAD(P)-dependent dehydrogenase (short-subunit alcohol dehydrogenase family)
MLTARSAIPRMRRCGGGSIVNFASYTAVHGSSDSHAYVAAKGGVISLTRALASRYAQDGIRVNAIAPGIVLTERVQRRIDDAGVDLDAIRKTHPHAITDPESIATVALFLASSDSAPITGAIVPADGGLTIF